ncbi:hypothetical protein C8J57DRAFT_1724768 [Mycena rebaudengoi]|nr:hypothetical protein C8J57DRAFT_1724768 [Mycena rebaudengoi]
MSHLRIDDPNIVVIPDVVKKPPANPLLRRDTVKGTPAPSAKATSMFGFSQSVLANRVLFNDQRCLLTGEVSTEIQACHLINATHNKDAKAFLKLQVEFILTRQGFNGLRGFFLDSLFNCLPFDVHWHGHLEKRGSFCVVVPMEQLWALLKDLVASNTNWDVRASTDPKAPRNLDTSAAPFIVCTYRILVLRPKLLLPDNKFIAINMERALRAPGDPLPQESATTSWVQHRLQAGSPYLVGESGTALKDIEFKSQRTGDDSLSIFALLVNAHYKLQALTPGGGTALLEEVTAYKQVINLLFDQIFFTPATLENPGPYPGGLVPPVPDSDSTVPPSSHLSGAPQTSTDSNIDIDSFGSGGGHEEVEACLDSDGESDYDSNSDSELNALQRLKALAQSDNPSLSPAEKGRAIMRGLGMSSHAAYDSFSPLLAQ